MIDRYSDSTGALRTRFELVISELVREEAGFGDQDAARARLSMLTSLAILDAAAEADRLAETLMRTSAVPQAAIRDAIHIAIAATNGVEYLVTWNSAISQTRRQGRSSSLRVGEPA